MTDPEPSLAGHKVDHTTVPRCAVVIVAAGRGLRLGAPVPKQFITIGDAPLFVHSLRIFDRLPFVVQIVLVTPAEGLPAEMLQALATLQRPLVCVPGGARRQDSVAAGLAALASDYEVALVHDAARPFAPADAIAELARAAARLGGGLLATRATDTIKRAAPVSKAQGIACVAETIDREQVWLAQTPQAIRADHAGRAIDAFRDPARDYTDEASLLESWSVPVALIEGGAGNFKVTRPEDLERARLLLSPA